jgi:hypothetical protein
MAVNKRTPLRFSLLTAFIWLLVAGGVSFLLWQVINHISTSNLPLSTPTPNPTQVYQTIAAALTAQPTLIVTNEPYTSTSMATGIFTLTSTSPFPSHNTTSTPGEPTRTPTPHSLCNQAAAGNPIDVTIPDDSLITPGQNFTKTWKLMNAGSCTWTTSYSADFFYGDRMGASDSVPLQEDVPPAHSVEISVEMVAPSTPGTYQGNWKLADPGGSLFGIGPKGDSPFWVRIIVMENQTTTPTATLGPSATSTPTGANTTTPTPEGQVSGQLSPSVGDGIDLDTLTLNDGDEDLAYREDANQYHWLSPTGQAMLGVYGSREPSEADCQTTNMSTAPIAVESLTPGTYLCYQTHTQRLGRMLFVALDPNSFTLTLDLLTWPALP